MNFKVAASPLLGLACLTSSFLSQAADTAADVLRLALPASAWLLTQSEANDEGEWMFYQSFAATVLTTAVLKSTVDAPRPDGSGQDSFPSGHAAMAFQGASFIQRRYGWQYGAPAYVLASYVGWNRVQEHHHYTKDVLAGALIGMVSSYWLVDPADDWHMTPQLSSRQVGLAVSGTF